MRLVRSAQNRVRTRYSAQIKLLPIATLLDQVGSYDTSVVGYEGSFQTVSKGLHVDLKQPSVVLRQGRGVPVMVSPDYDNAAWDGFFGGW